MTILSPDTESNASTSTSVKSRPELVLVLIALACASLIYVVHSWTRGPIQQAKDDAIMEKFSAVVPRSEFNNNVAQDCISRIDRDWLGSDEPVKIFRFRQDQSDVAVLVQAIAPDGFGGRIDLAIGVYLDAARSGRLAGVRVQAHKETPGLGDQIDALKSNWIKQFSGLSLQQPVEEKWALKKDGGQFDAFTGATVSPRAVVKAVQRTLHYVALHQQTLFTEPSSCHAL